MKLFLRITSLSIIFTLILCINIFAGYDKLNSNTVVIDGEQLRFSQDILVNDNTTFFPLPQFLDFMGISSTNITMNGNTVIFSDGGVLYTLTADSNFLLINDTLQYELYNAPFLYNNTMYIPIRELSNLFNYTVDYDFLTSTFYFASNGLTMFKFDLSDRWQKFDSSIFELNDFLGIPNFYSNYAYIDGTFVSNANDSLITIVSEYVNGSSQSLEEISSIPNMLDNIFTPVFQYSDIVCLAPFERYAYNSDFYIATFTSMYDENERYTIAITFHDDSIIFFCHFNNKTSKNYETDTKDFHNMLYSYYTL